MSYVAFSTTNSSINSYLLRILVDHWLKGRATPPTYPGKCDYFTPMCRTCKGYQGSFYGVTINYCNFDKQCVSQRTLAIDEFFQPHTAKRITEKSLYLNTLVQNQHKFHSYSQKMLQIRSRRLILWMLRQMSVQIVNLSWRTLTGTLINWCTSCQ